MNDNVWNKFNPLAYVADNYDKVHEEDRAIIDKLIQFFEHLPKQQSVLEVGTGPNLYPTMLALPIASNITCLEYSQNNIEYFNDQLQSPANNWLQFWQYMQTNSKIYSQYDLLTGLRTKIHISQGDIFKLPPKLYDLVMMFFIAESITSFHDQFINACNKFVNAAKQNGILIAAFMENSTGYKIDKQQFPSISVNLEDIQSIFEPLTYDLIIHHIPVAKNPLRSGYTGMLLITAKKR